MEESFYQRLKFYNWLLNRPEGKTFAEYGLENELASSTLARWHSRFDTELFIAIISQQVSSRNIREQIIKKIQSEALSGNIQAAKIVLSELEDITESFENQPLTVDQALRIIREFFDEKRK